MNNSVKKIVLSTFVAGVLVGCGGGGGTITGTNVNTGAGGGAQKGPFKIGQTVTATKLFEANETGAGTPDSNYTPVTTTTDALGKFNFSSLPWSGTTEFKVEGEYLDENTGEYVPGGLLTSVTNVEAGTVPKVNINILTHIAAQNIIEQMKNNVDIDTAKEEAKKTVSKVFKINLENTNLEELDLTNENNDTATDEQKAANTQLLKISAALSATEDPEKTLETLAEDLKDGEVDDEAEATFEELKEEEQQVELSEVAKNLKSVIDVDTIPDNEDFLNGTMSLNNNIEFVDELEASISTSYESNVVSISGIIGTKSANISIVGGEYSLDGGTTWTSTSATEAIKNNDTLVLRATSSNSFDTKSTATVTIGGVEFDFHIVTESDPFVADKRIKAFDFVSKIKQNLGVEVISSPVIVEGINTATEIAITNGEYKIGNGSWVSTAGTINPGETLEVKHNTSSDYSARVKTTVTFGSSAEGTAVDAEFKSYTIAQDRTPDTFSIATKYDQTVSSAIEFDPVVITGINGAVKVNVTNGQYSISTDNGTTWSAFTSTEGTVNNNDQIKVQHTTSDLNNTKTTSSLVVGTKIAEFSSYSEVAVGQADTSVEEFELVPEGSYFVNTQLQTVEVDTSIESEEVTITGVDTDISISIQNGEYSLDGGTTWTNDAGSVSNNDTLKVRHTSSSSNLEKTETTLTIGSFETQFVSFTKAPVDDLPFHVNFMNKDAQDINTQVESNAVFVRGINAEVSVSITNGEYSISTDGGVNWSNWSSSTGVINDNNQIKVRQTTSTDASTESITELTVGSDPLPFVFKTYTKPDAPIAGTNTPGSSVTTGSAYSFTPDVTGATEWEITNRPEWAYFNKVTGVLSGTPNKADFQKTYSGIVITAKNDGGSTVLDSFDITVNNFVPVLTPEILTKNTTQGATFSYDVTLEDKGNDSKVFTLEGAPDFVNIDANTGTISGTAPSVNSSTLHNFIIKVTDGSDATDTVTINLTVDVFSSVPSLPEISGTPATTVDEDSAYSFTPNANDANSANLTFGIENKPSWASFDTSTGALTGTPTNFNVGTNENIIISVTEGSDTVSLSAFSIEVVNTNDAPTAANIPNQNVVQDIVKTINLSSFISDIDVGDTLTYDVTFANGDLLPNWMDFNPQSAVLTVNGTSTHLGEHLMKITATDAANISVVKEFTIIVTDGSTPLDTDVNNAIKKLESIDPEIENIDTKLGEAKTLLENNTTPEAKIVSLMIGIAEIANDSDIAALLEFSNTSLDSTTTLNKVVRSIVSDVISTDVIDNPTDLSLTAITKLNTIADELKKISDEFANLFNSTDDSYVYDGESMDYNDSLVLRSSILSFAAQLKQLASYQWVADADIAIQDYQGNDYTNIDVDPAGTINSGSVYKLISSASTRLPEAKQNLTDAIDLLLELPLGYGADEEDSSDTGMTQEDKDDMNSIKLSLAGTTALTLDIDDQEEDISEVKVDLSKVFDSTTALDITSYGSNWQNLCDYGDILSIEQAKMYGELKCYLSDMYNVIYHYDSVELKPQTMPTAETSKIDDIVLSITKFDGTTVLSGQDMIDFVLEGEGTLESFGTTWSNSKYGTEYLQNGNDANEEKLYDPNTSTNYNGLMVNANKSNGLNSKAQAKKKFTTPKSEIKAEMVLLNVDEVDSTTGRAAMMAVMNNINSSDERIYAHIQLRNNQVRYYIGRYDSTGNTELEDYTDYSNGNHKFEESSTVLSSEQLGKFAVSIETSGSDIILNVKKLHHYTDEVLETYSEKVITTDASFDLAIDEARFRTEVRLSNDDGTLYDQITAPTKLRVYSFEAVSAMDTLSFPELTARDFLAVGDDWYDRMSYSGTTLTGTEYYKNNSGSYVTDNDTFTLTVTPDGTNNKLASYIDTATGEEGTMLLSSTSTINGYTDVYKTISNMEVTTAGTTLEWDRWEDWANPTYPDGLNNPAVTDLASLIAAFTADNPMYTDSENYDAVMLTSDNKVVKAVATGTDGSGNTTYERGTVQVGSWTTDTTESIGRIVLTIDNNEKLFIRVVNDTDYYIETAEQLLPGFTFSEEFISADSDNALNTYISDNF